MKEEIKRELSRLEKQHDIKILYAVESGSRAWGFASTDSDWDVRYIYVHKLDWYLEIDSKRDNQEEILPNDIDLAGWELKKALRLFRKSNPPMLEWLRSPLVYLQQSSTADKLRDLVEEYFSPRACLHHYLHMAERNFQAYLLKERVRVKKYFYVLRPLLACDWIWHTNTMAPMEFHRLVDSQVADASIKTLIQELLTRKMAGEELGEEPKNQLLNDFLEEKIIFYNQCIKSLGPVEQPDTTRLNKLFKETLYEAWGNDDSC
ncbi:nucleotidyltransferase domain-containing protein [Fibrella aestuarina]|uniref:nucleotidyltransferase domain-containing protein n=1 Tax=Fibrella aestuarina TaxID=651143 RepID=UPI00059CC5B7|nr:nucleotidyltransferase domain-containing protein [Fibrella aestuarina]